MDEAKRAGPGNNLRQEKGSRLPLVVSYPKEQRT